MQKCHTQHSDTALKPCATEPDELGALPIWLEPNVEISAKRVRRQSALNLFAGLISQGLKVLIVIYVARSFSPALFGALSFAIAVNAFIFIVAHFGLPVYGSRAIARTGTIDADLLLSICGVRVLLTVFGTGVSLAALWLMANMSRTELLLVAIFGLSNIPIAVLLDWVFQGLHRQDISAVLSIFWQFLWLACVVIGTRMGANILVVPASLCISALLTAMVGYLWLRRSYQIETARDSGPGIWRQAMKILTSGGALGIATLLITVLVWTDAIVIRLISGDQAVATYAAGNRAALALAMLASYFVQGAFPVLSSARSRDQFRACFHECYKDLACGFLPISFWAFFYAPELIALMFARSEYLAAVHVFRVFQLVFLVTIFANLFGIGVLVARQRDAGYRRTLLLATAVFIPLCVGLVLTVGVVGAAVASLAVQVLCALGFLRQSRALVDVDHSKVLLPPFATGLVMMSIVAGFHLTLVWGSALLLAAYSVTMVIRFQASTRTAELL